VLVSTPHFVCRCPNGRIKPFCLGLTSAKAECCCAGGCCCSTHGPACCCEGAPRTIQAATADQATESACCRRPHDEQTATSVLLGDQASVRQTCCTKTLVRPESLSASYSKPTYVKDVTSDSFLSAGAQPVPRLPEQDHYQVLWRNHQIPPPTNLVILLQHLVL
jgi:hypothetical protein